jgi:hypothetical protein
MQKVQAGDPLKIPAATFNTFIDAARGFQARTSNRGRKAQPGFRQSGIVPVKNGSGVDCGRFSVLGIDSPVFTPPEGLESFQNQVALVGVTPSASTHAGSFVVLLEPVAYGEIGMGCVDGVCPAVIAVTEEEHEYADLDDGQMGWLASGISGSARILWKEAGTGLKWAIVRLGVGCPPALFPVAVTVSGGSAGGPAEDCSLTYTVKDLNGTVLGTDLTPQVARFTNVEYLQPPEDSPGVAYLDSGGNVQLYHVAGEIPKTDRVQVQTQYRIDGANNKFQVKHRYIRVLEAEDEDAAWADVHTGTECPT